MPDSRNILIAPYGNSANVLPEHWLKYKDEKDFDVCLLFYHQEILQPEKYKDVEFFFHLKGFKYRMAHEVLMNIHPEWMDKYDYFYFIDDDVQIDTRDINKLFALSKANDTWMSQASLTQDSYCSWPILKNVDSCYLRYLGQIEVMAPMFSKYALKICLEAGTFVTNNSSWGIDCAWTHLLGYSKTRNIVFDCIQMKHIHPVGKGELYKKINDPYNDWVAVTKKYSTKFINYVEYGRLIKVDYNHNTVLFKRIKFIEKIGLIRKSYSDYPFSARVKNRLNKAFHVFKKPAAF